MLLFALAVTPWSSDTVDLDPTFRPAVERVVARLTAEGFHPIASCTYRSADVQEWLYAAGPSVSQARGGQSCHNHTVNGRPAALAVDLWDGGMSLGIFAGEHDALTAQVPFLRALGAAAKAEGLRWGGGFSHRAPWAEWELGWDPAHIEDRRCGAGR